MSRHFTWIVALALAAQGGITNAQEVKTYSYFEGTALGIGQGINLGHLADSKVSCLNYREKRLTSGAATTSLEVNYVSDLSALDIARGVDISAKATGWGASVDGSYNRKYTSSFSNYSATLVITAQSDYGPWGLEPGASLEAVASGLLAVPNSFAARCGTYYVNREWRGSSVSAVIRIDNISSSLKDAISTSFGASAKYGVVSGEMRAKFENEIRKSSKSGKASVEIKAMSGLGVQALEGVVALSLSSDKPLEEIARQLGNYLKTFSADTAVPYKYQVRPMSDFDLPSSSLLPWDDKNNEILEMLTQKYRLMASDVEGIESLLSGSHVLGPYIGDRRTKLTDEIADIKQSMIETRNSYDDCKRTSICSRPNRYPKNYILDYIEKKPAVTFYIPDLSPPQIRAVLSHRRATRTIAANNFFPSQKTSWGATVTITGFKLVANQMVFIADKTGVVSTITFPSNAEYAGIWYTTDKATLAAGAMRPESELQGDMETSIVNWLQSMTPKHTGDYSGTLAMKTSNAAGQVFETNFGQLSWTERGGKLTDYQIKID